MKAFDDLYAAVERTWFHTLARKLVGNVGVLALFPILMAAVLWSGRNSLDAALATAGLTPEVAQRLSHVLDAQLMVAAGLCVAGLIAALAVFLYLRHLIVRPVRALASKMREIGAGYRHGRHGKFEEIIDRVAEYRDCCAERLMVLSARGINVFDQDYRAIPGTDPQKHHTAYDRECEKELQPLYDRLVEETPCGAFALAIDVRACAPTHNSKYSKAPTGNRAVDLAASRDKRMFNDAAGTRAAANRARFLLQTYRRDTGEILNDLSMPIEVGGRHWGCLRFGFSPEILLRGD
jgi:hypothetical protein